MYDINECTDRNYPPFSSLYAKELQSDGHQFTGVSPGVLPVRSLHSLDLLFSYIYIIVRITRRMQLVVSW